MDPLQAVAEYGAFLFSKDPWMDLHDVVGANPEEVRVECGVVKLTESDAVHHG